MIGSAVRISTWRCRKNRIVASVALLASALPCAFAQTPSTPPLNPAANWFVNGDYVVGGVGLRGQGVNGYATGVITVPDANQPGLNTIPVGADIVAALLYWQTVEKSQSPFAGRNGYFNGYPITGTVLGNPNAPVSWSGGGCAGASNGATTLRTYRTDVRGLLNVDRISSTVPLSYQVSLPDSGSNGGGSPLVLGATIVVVYQRMGQSPSAYPLRGISIYDGAYAPSNSSQTMTQSVGGFYDPAAGAAADAKITHIVGNGQPNKSQTVRLNGTALTSPYSALPPFPGYYGGSWDNPSWPVGNLLLPPPPVPDPTATTYADPAELTTVVPSPTNSGCVSWAAIVLSTKVNDGDGDLLLNRWEAMKGYFDFTTGQWVALPGADPAVADAFVEVDWLDDGVLPAIPGIPSTIPHTHLLKLSSLNQAGDAFANNQQGPIKAHFDVGPIYQGTDSPYTIKYPIAYPSYVPDSAKPPSYTGGNAMPEQAFLCTDSPGSPLCPFVGQPVLLWKGGFMLAQQLTYWKSAGDAALCLQGQLSGCHLLGAFQPGRRASYHYALSGHALGAPRSIWTAGDPGAPNRTLGRLVSLVNSGNTATVTIQSVAGFLKPGDAGTDQNLDRITIAGAIGTTALNGTYRWNTLSSTTANDVTTTTFTITTSGVPSGYAFSSTPQATLLPAATTAYEPILAVAFGGPTSTSGHADLPGGDLALTFGLWLADDPLGCQPNPAVGLAPNQSYCNSQVGAPRAVAGTLLHEFGHNAALTHGGGVVNGIPLPTSDVNCKPNYLSVMNYQFQIRGIPGPLGASLYDYLEQDMTSLNETSLVEPNGIYVSQPFTRWYGPPSAADIQAQNTTGGRYATRRCDGTPVLPTDPPMVRLDSAAPPVDWNNSGAATQTVGNVDVNFDGNIGGVFQAFKDWDKLDLHQVGARPNGFGLSSGAGALTGGGGALVGGGGALVGGGGALTGGGGALVGGGGALVGGGGALVGGGGALVGGGGALVGGGGALVGGGGALVGGGGALVGGGGDQDFDAFNSTVDPPANLQATQPASRQVKLSWSPPDLGQIRRYYVWRAEGNFPTLTAVNANIGAFSIVATISPVGQNPVPATTFTDTAKLKKTMYTYFVTGRNVAGAQSGASVPVVVTVIF